MDKLGYKKILVNGLKDLKDSKLIDSIAESIVTTYEAKETSNDWQRLRYLKKRADEIWEAVKNLSEKELVKERSKELKRVLSQIQPSIKRPVAAKTKKS